MRHPGQLLTTYEQAPMEFEPKISEFYLIKFVSKCRLQNHDQFVQVWKY